MVSCSKINLRLLPMKAVMFGWFGASACAIPFMTIHMKELGLTVEETAVVYTLLPITQFLSSPLAGFIADRIGKYRDVLLLSILMTIVIATALLYVPPISPNITRNNSAAEIYCKNERLIFERCDNFSLLQTTEKELELQMCNMRCDKLTFKNSFIDMPLTIKLMKNSRDCAHEVESIIIQKNISSLTCDLHSPSIPSNCSIMCHMMNSTLENPADSKSGRQLTFYLYCTFRIIYNIFSAIGFTLVNSSAIALTEMDRESGEYGRQRFWAILGMAVFSPLAGIMVDLISTEDGVMNYAPAFHFHNVLSLLTGIAVWYLNFEIEDTESSFVESFKNFWQLVKRPSIFFLLIVVFWLGTMWGFLESFLFWFMSELGSPKYMMGLTVTIGSLAGLPFLHYSRYIVSKIGHANLLSIAVFMYMIRGIGCSYLIDPWWILPFEVLEIFTYHLMWVAAATYAAQLSPPGLLATIQGIIEGVHYGVGQGSGSLIGGSLISSLGSRAAFRVMGGISGAVALIYSILHLVWLRKETPITRPRRASIKFHSSFNSKERKNSTLSSVEVNGTTIPHAMELQGGTN
ncbi:major facilitator superfamily domain-containing protein 6-like [Uloborus diversus]|uniref:major facilitator superfamily domain-containing protein 6-like n=1 Tax=Uloborus diversus TaxID=327109 RepID=UPI0024092DD4|nr:major facilitator superfamily domain-containing protein 6-like [Uloborus diversus]XP_054708753.1 major facilitator superfamily domain-containing protein 6-like [Uloborus diversus]